MLTRQSVHVSMLLWGAGFNLIAALCMYMGKGFEKNKRIWMQGCRVIINICITMQRGGL